MSFFGNFSLFDDSFGVMVNWQKKRFFFSTGFYLHLLYCCVISCKFLLKILCHSIVLFVDFLSSIFLPFFFCHFLFCFFLLTAYIALKFNLNLTFTVNYFIYDFFSHWFSLAFFLAIIVADAKSNFGLIFQKKFFGIRLSNYCW